MGEDRTYKYTIAILTICEDRIDGEHVMFIRENIRKVLLNGGRKLAEIFSYNTLRSKNHLVVKSKYVMSVKFMNGESV